eukprot:scaffold3774_cov126-Cylindrotheca_fusiformis.AAC.3
MGKTPTRRTGQPLTMVAVSEACSIITVMTSFTRTNLSSGSRHRAIRGFVDGFRNQHPVGTHPLTANDSPRHVTLPITSLSEQEKRSCQRVHSGVGASSLARWRGFNDGFMFCCHTDFEKRQKILVETSISLEHRPFPDWLSWWIHVGKRQDV